MIHFIDTVAWQHGGAQTSRFKDGVGCLREVSDVLLNLAHCVTIRLDDVDLDFSLAKDFLFMLDVSQRIVYHVAFEGLWREEALDFTFFECVVDPLGKFGIGLSVSLNNVHQFASEVFTCAAR